MMASAAGATTAAPRPWTARKPTSASGDHARPHKSEETVKIAKPRRNIRRLPKRSASLPARSRKPPKKST
jgi:hypothetical protein